MNRNRALRGADKATGVPRKHDVHCLIVKRCPKKSVLRSIAMPHIFAKTTFIPTGLRVEYSKGALFGWSRKAFDFCCILMSLMFLFLLERHKYIVFGSGFFFNDYINLGPCFRSGKILRIFSYTLRYSSSCMIPRF